MHRNPGANSRYVVDCWNPSVSCSLFFSYFVLALPLMFFSLFQESSNFFLPAANKNRPWGAGGNTGDISRPDEVGNQSGKRATIFISLSLSQKTSQPPRSSTRRSPSLSPKQKSGDSSILRGHWGDRSPSVVEKRHQSTMISHNMALGLQGMVSGWWFLDKIQGE